MIKLLLLILLGLAITFFGYKVFLSDNPSVNLPGSNQPISPTDAIEGAKDAVEQSQDVQNQLNQRAQDQLYR
jgi:hypothetical protein